MRRTNPYVRTLRRNQTDVEQRFWLAVRDRRLSGFKFRRQASIGPFIVDFLCVERRLIVELDGGQHGEARDQQRTAFLEQRGYRVLRFWNNEVLENWQSVLETVQRALGDGPSPSPPAAACPSPAGGRGL